MSSSSAKDRKHSYADLGPRMVSDMSSEIPLSGTEERRGQTLFPITSNFATRVLPPFGTIPNKPDEMYSSKLRIGVSHVSYLAVGVLIAWVSRIIDGL